MSKIAFQVSIKMTEMSSPTQPHAQRHKVIQTTAVGDGYDHGRQSLLPAAPMQYSPVGEAFGCATQVYADFMVVHEHEMEGLMYQDSTEYSPQHILKLCKYPQDLGGLLYPAFLVNLPTDVIVHITPPTHSCFSTLPDFTSLSPPAADSSVCGEGAIVASSRESILAGPSGCGSPPSSTPSHGDDMPPSCSMKRRDRRNAIAGPPAEEVGDIIKRWKIMRNAQGWIEYENPKEFWDGLSKERNGECESAQQTERKDTGLTTDQINVEKDSKAERSGAVSLFMGNDPEPDN